MVTHRPLPLLVLVATAVLGLLTGVVAVLATRDDAAGSTTTAVQATEPHARRVLRAWDSRRASAYARRDLAALTDLYLPGSRTGAADLAVLRDYRDRGLRVTGMRMQVLGARVVHETDERIVVVVTDVLVDAVVDDGDDRWSLPRDRPSTRRVVLVEQHGTWRVAEAYVTG